MYTPPPPQNFNVKKQNTLSNLQRLHTTNLKMRKLIIMEVFQLALELVGVKVIRKITKIMFNHL